jgi:hypothetical protein
MKRPEFIFNGFRNLENLVTVLLFLKGKHVKMHIIALLVVGKVHLVEKKI